MALTHLIIGAGNMGGAILAGWLQKNIVNSKNVAILDPNPGYDAVYAIERGAKHIPDVKDIPKTIETVLLAIKPQLFANIKDQLAKAIPDDALVISIMAGVSTDGLNSAFPNALPIRAMPNTPSSIGKGMTAYVSDTRLDIDLTERLETLLAANGEVVSVDSDDQINAVTGVSGSGPAYVFFMCEAMAKAGEEMGLDKDVAAKLAKQTMVGASALMEASDRTPSELRKAVTSPNGTTQAALDVLMGENGIQGPVSKAVKAAFDRAHELSK